MKTKVKVIIPHFSALKNHVAFNQFSVPRAMSIDLLHLIIKPP